MDFLIYNNKIVQKEEINLSKFLYENSFSLKQKIWYGFGGIPLFTENIRLIEKQAEALKLPLPEFFKNKREFFRITKRMLNKNKFYRSGLIKIYLFWQNKKVETLITSSAFSFFDFPFSEEGILITSSNHKKHSQNSLNQFAIYNDMAWKTTLRDLTGTYYKNAVITNEKNAVCECPFSNIFFLKGNEIMTPALTTGCYDDILRSTVLKMTKSLKLIPVESDNIQLSDLPKMDEIFLASEQNGIQWVLGFENKRFLHRHSSNIHEKLNEFLKTKSTD
jgi:branched-chain amino acid aminotransferase